MSESEKEIQDKVAKLIQSALDEMLIPEAAFGEPAPLTIMGVLQKLIENPDYVLVCDYTVYKLARELRKNNVKLKRERRGKWLLVSESGKEMGILYISRMTQGCYLIPNYKPPKLELKLDIRYEPGNRFSFGNPYFRNYWHWGDTP